MRKRSGGILLLLFGLLTACAGSAPGIPEAQLSAPTSTPIPTAPAVARPTYIVQRGDVQEILEFSGRWLPRDQSSLGFEIAGTIRRVEIRRGDTVTAGQLLADLQITELENQLASGQLELESAQAGLESGAEGGVQSVADAQIALANANLRLESAKANSPWTESASARIALDDAQRELEEAQRVYDDALSRPDQPASTVDNARSQVESAQSRLRNAQNSYDGAAQRFNNYQFTIAEAENAVIQAEIQLQNVLSGASGDAQGEQAVRAAQLRIDQINASIRQSSLYAPIDGEVLEVNIQPGNAVEAFGPVIIVGRSEPKEAIATLALNDAQRLSVGLVGVCNVINQPETAVQCIVRQLPLSARDADQTTRVAASLEQVADVASGQLIEIAMPLQVREDVLWLPPAAIRTFQNRTFVVLQTPEGQRSVDIQIGLRTADQVEIVSGVSEGDIVEGQ